MFERRPASNKISVRDQHTRCVFVRTQDADRLAGLNKQRLVIFKRLERIDDAIE